jgi:hypothetical protein
VATLLDALNDPALFAPCFPAPSWTAWRAFCAALVAGTRISHPLAALA